MSGIVAFVKGAWKAVAAAASPAVAALVTDLANVVSERVSIIVGSAVAALLVYLVPNQES